MGQIYAPDGTAPKRRHRDADRCEMIQTAGRLEDAVASSLAPDANGAPVLRGPADDLGGSATVVGDRGGGGFGSGSDDGGGDGGGFIDG